DFNAFIEQHQPRRLFALSTKGQIHYHHIQYKIEDTLLFGPETRGLPTNVLDALDTNNILRIPMSGESRSLNLANAAAIVSYEAWRQLDFI
ncbi:MAG: TrmH family RNA methyltransferase, partial [Gammaproteobacteria bacterium]